MSVKKLKIKMLICTKHHDSNIAQTTEEKLKPEIIMAYNSQLK